MILLDVYQCTRIHFDQYFTFYPKCKIMKKGAIWCWWDRGRYCIKEKGRLAPGTQVGRLVGINFSSTCICSCGGQYRASGSHESPAGRRLGFRRSNWFFFTSSVSCLQRLISVTYSHPWPTINLDMRLYLKNVTA